MSTQVRDRVATVSDELAEFIITALQWDGAKEDLLADEPVELPEILDSADLLELAGFLEDNYGIEISDEEVVAETFASVAILAQIVVAKQAAQRRAVAVQHRDVKPKDDLVVGSV